MIRRSILFLVLLGAGWPAIAADAPPSPLVILAQQAPNAAAWVLAPLDQTVAADIRQNLTFLREDLLDEGKTKPKAGAETYKLGYQLCNGMIAALDERDQALVRAGVTIAAANARTGVSNQALEARRNYQTSWPQYERERDQRDELKNQAANQVAVIKERPKVEWAGRAAQHRTYLDAVYAKYRDALRQTPALLEMIAGVPAKDAPTPPAATATTTPVAPATTAGAAGGPSSKGNENGRAGGDAVVQVLAGNKPASGAMMLVTEAQPKDEETLIAEVTSDDGKFSFPANAGVKYNIYVVLEGYDAFVKKNCSAANLPQVTLKPSSAGTKVILGQKAVGIPLLGGAATDIVPTRANQGSPPFQWLMEIGGSGVVVDAGKKLSSGEFWMKHGDTVRLTWPDRKASCTLVASIARKYVIFECKSAAR